jgi:hypothetical protein
VRGVGHTVQCAVAEDGIVKETQPFADATVAGERETAPTMTLDDELVEVLALLRGQAAEPEVVHDEKVRC